MQKIIKMNIFLYEGLIRHVVKFVKKLGREENI